MNSRIRWLRAEWPTSTTMLEIPIYLMVVGAMGLVGLYSAVYAQRHLHVLEALSVMTGPRATMMEFRAVTGEWPTTNSQAGFSDATFQGGHRDLYRVSSVQVRRGGVIDFGIARGASKESVLSIRASEGRSPGLPIEWACGHAPSLSGTTAATDHTTLSDDDLPSPCRARK